MYSIKNPCHTINENIDCYTKVTSNHSGRLKLFTKLDGTKRFHKIGRNEVFSQEISIVVSLNRSNWFQQLPISFKNQLTFSLSFMAHRQQ